MARINTISTFASYGFDTFSSFPDSQKAPPSYKLMKCIGFGGYGRVYEGIRSDDGLPVIIKLLPKAGIVNWSANSQHQYSLSSNNYGSSRSTNSSNSLFLPFEIECLLRLRDTPGIINIYDFFEEATCFVIVMEKLERSITLFDMANGKPFSFNQNMLKKIFTQVIRINMTLFSKGIVHRDIKPENILVNLDDLSIKLIDFGSAANYRSRGEVFREFQGTLECMPPEWILQGFYESEPATVWSIGVTYYFCVFGRYPYRTKSQIVSGKFPILFNSVSSESLQFLDYCFQMNPIRRPSLTQLLNLCLLKRV
jgi:serine/threonine protein kinase